MELFLDDGQGLSDQPQQSSFLHDFFMAITAVVLIVVLSIIMVSCINRQYRRDFEYDYEKAEQLFERCLTQEDLAEKHRRGAREDEIAAFIKMREKEKEINQLLQNDIRARFDTQFSSDHMGCQPAASGGLRGSLNNKVFTDFKANAVSGSDFAKVGIQAFLREKRKTNRRTVIAFNAQESAEFGQYHSGVTEIQRVTTKKRSKTDKKSKANNINLSLKKRSSTHKIGTNVFTSKAVKSQNISGAKSQTCNQQKSISFPTSEFDELVNSKTAQPEIFHKISIENVSQDVELNNFFTPEGDEDNISDDSDERNFVDLRNSVIHSFGEINLISSNNTLKQGPYAPFENDSTKTLDFIPNISIIQPSRPNLKRSKYDKQS